MVENIVPAVWAIEIKNAKGANFIVHLISLLSVFSSL
nr:MAG TPA: hypothetical protein [Caudoviricetes sp.]